MLNDQARAMHFEAPGPGHWRLDRSHFPGGTTPIMQSLISRALEDAFRKQWPLLGIPAETMSTRFVHGFFYTRLRPLVAPDKPAAKPPPTAVLKVAARTHPEFRRRAKAAERTLAESPAPPVIEEWRTQTRPRLVAQNLAFQEVELGALDDAILAGYLDAVIVHLRWTYEEHFRLHGYDLGPIAKLLLTGKEWGISAADMVPALAGASPSTMAPLEALDRLRHTLQVANVVPTTLDDVRAASPVAAAELDAYLRRRGAVLYAGYDIDTPTLGEAPHVVLATIVNGPADRSLDVEQHEACVDALRSRVPAAARAQFDRLLFEAREAMDMRDDNGPITVEWPSGLLRLGMVEAGERLQRTGRMHQADHVFELGPAELLTMTRSQTGPTAEELRLRSEHRALQKTLDPPVTLGDPEAPPPLDALPRPLAQTVMLVETAITELGMDGGGQTSGSGLRLTGTGVGDESLVGRACVAADADEAFDVLQPGDILVTRTTSPAYNMVLTLVGGLVTAEGGPMSHAAVLSRELDIPAVVGAPDALRAINSGDLIEIDPASGTVRLVGD